MRTFFARCCLALGCGALGLAGCTTTNATSELSATKTEPKPTLLQSFEKMWDSDQEAAKQERRSEVSWWEQGKLKKAQKMFLSEEDLAKVPPRKITIGGETANEPTATPGDPVAQASVNETPKPQAVAKQPAPTTKPKAEAAAVAQASAGDLPADLIASPDDVQRAQAAIAMLTNNPDAAAPTRKPTQPQQVAVSQPKPKQAVAAAESEPQADLLKVNPNAAPTPADLVSKHRWRQTIDLASVGRQRGMAPTNETSSVETNVTTPENKRTVGALASAMRAEADTLAIEDPIQSTRRPRARLTSSRSSKIPAPKAEQSRDEVKLAALVKQAQQSYANTRNYEAMLSWQTSDSKGEVALRFRKQPHSVLAGWDPDPSKGRQWLYVQGKYNDQIVMRDTTGFGFLRHQEGVNSDKAKEIREKPITQWGIHNLLAEVEQTLALAKRSGAKIEHVGTKNLNDHPAEVVQVEVASRKTTIEYYFDVATHLPVLAIERNAKGQLVRYEHYGFLATNLDRLDEDQTFDADTLFE